MRDEDWARRRAPQTQSFFRSLLDQLREDGLADLVINELDFDGLLIDAVVPNGPAVAGVPWFPRSGRMKASSAKRSTSFMPAATAVSDTRSASAGPGWPTRRRIERQTLNSGVGAMWHPGGVQVSPASRRSPACRLPLPYRAAPAWLETAVRCWRSSRAADSTGP